MDLKKLNLDTFHYAKETVCIWEMGKYIVMNFLGWFQDSRTRSVGMKSLTVTLPLGSTLPNPYFHDQISPHRGPDEFINALLSL